jgi:signal transduction histidine kinase
VRRAEAAGLTVQVRTTGQPVPLPAGVDLAAFRIVQEALTNVIRHAQADTATVCLDYRPGEFAVQVDDDGHGRPDGPVTGGGNRSRACTNGRTRSAVN